MIYLASPYSSSDKTKVDYRFAETEKAVAELTRRDLHVISPVVHFHALAQKYDLGTDAIFWRRHNYELLMLCEDLYILALPEWQYSCGIAYELGVAHAAQKRVWLLDSDTYVAVRMGI